ncbi:MAG: HlyD family secretion protein [Candidatus Methylomirabilia bacterium]
MADPAGSAPEYLSQRRVPLRRRLALGVAAVLLLAGLGYGISLWRYWQTRVSTDAAFVEAHIAPVSAKVSGTVSEVLVADNQEVEAGDLLVRLDPRDFQVQVERAQAAVLMAQGTEQRATSAVPLSDESTRSLVRQAEAVLEAATLEIEIAAAGLEERRSHLRARQAGVAAARAAVEAAQARSERAQLDRARMRELVQADLVAQQEFDHAMAASKTAQADLESARRKLDEAKGEVQQAEAEVRSQTLALARARRRVEESQARLANAKSRRREVGLQRAEVETARGSLAEARARLREAELYLGYTTIRAPASGRVTRKTAEVGQVIQPGQPLLAIVSLDEVWVIANYKETQLTHVRPGQRATITVDTYPGVAFEARVDSIQAGTGSRFSLLPPENASGNFVKIVQRIPVKLVFEPGVNQHHLLVPGMSVISTIETR